MKLYISTISSFVSPGISQVVRSVIRETLAAISWLWLSTKLRSNRLKPHNHLLPMILVLLPMIPILSALVLNCNTTNNFGLWPFRIPLYILAVLWYNWSSIGGALTRWGTRADRAIFTDRFAPCGTETLDVTGIKFPGLRSIHVATLWQEDPR